MDATSTPTQNTRDTYQKNNTRQVTPTRSSNIRTRKRINGTHTDSTSTQPPTALCTTGTRPGTGSPQTSPPTGGSPRQRGEPSPQDAPAGARGPTGKRGNRSRSLAPPHPGAPATTPRTPGRHAVRAAAAPGGAPRAPRWVVVSPSTTMGCYPPCSRPAREPTAAKAQRAAPPEMAQQRGVEPASRAGGRTRLRSQRVVAGGWEPPPPPAGGDRRPLVGQSRQRLAVRSPGARATETARVGVPAAATGNPTPRHKDPHRTYQSRQRAGEDTTHPPPRRSRRRCTPNHDKKAK